VPPQKIVVLTGRSLSKSSLKRGDKLGDFVLSSDAEGKNHIHFETVRRFKGMERSVVIVVEIDSQSDDVKYIAFSRASSQLIVISDGATVAL
jgi:hypothetical protein